MSVEASFEPTQTQTGLEGVIKIAILAVGGQGGGVLTNWIADLATRGGYAVQATSVAGVAQRTGATIYYLEMTPKSDRLPVFAQSPAPGDVDIMIAAELMEAGRSIMRGFVTPDRTTLIASTHRILAVSEKQVPGDGRANAETVSEEIANAALNAICFDMEKIAANAGSVISSSLFGALAKSGVLPFETALFEEVISASGRGVEQSLAAFHAALAFDETAPQEAGEVEGEIPTVHGPEKLLAGWNLLVAKLDAIDPEAREMAELGLRKVVDYQDLKYGEAYVSAVIRWARLDNAAEGFQLTQAAAKYIANAMCYDDIIRVADLKIRASRENRLRMEQQAVDNEIVHVTEYFHPRAEEISSTMPAFLGKWFQNSPRAFKLLDKLFNRGRRIRTDRLSGFLLLKAVASLKPYRRSLLRHREEQNHLEELQAVARSVVGQDYQLAVEVFNCQRLIKGYSDTHSRGQTKFAKVIGAAAVLAGREDAAQWVRRLRDVALKDEAGTELDGAIKTIASFAGDSSS